MCYDAMLLCASLWNTLIFYFVYYWQIIFSAKEVEKKWTRNKERVLEIACWKRKYRNGKLIQTPENVVSLQDAIKRVKHYEKLFHREKQNVINDAYRQGYILPKFKESEEFIETVKKLGISKSPVAFKINLYKLFKKFLLIKQSTKSMHWFKYFFLQIKLIYQTSGNQVKHLITE